jgi:hypothetical protein
LAIFLIQLIYLLTNNNTTILLNNIEFVIHLTTDKNIMLYDINSRINYFIISSYKIMSAYYKNNNNSSNIYISYETSGLCYLSYNKFEIMYKCYKTLSEMLNINLSPQLIIKSNKSKNINIHIIENINNNFTDICDTYILNKKEQNIILYNQINITLDKTINIDKKLI